MENLDKLIEELRKLDNETPWLEFKNNNYKPEMIGEDISALANSATLHERSCAYMLWGIDDQTHDIIGTKKNLQNIKVGGQEVESWLRNMLSGNADFSFEQVAMPQGIVGVLIIQKAANQPVTFKKTSYVRIGSYTKKLNEYPAVEAQLWDRLRNERFEERYAKQDLTLTQTLGMLDYNAYFDLMNMQQPTDEKGIAHYMLEEKCIVRLDNGMYAITNVGAVLFAKKLSDFEYIARKAVRIVQYRGNNRLNLLKDELTNKGYASGFEGLIKYIEALLPSEEVINGPLRERRSTYPSLAVREIVANALIHQDFSISGTGPTIEVFDNRVEVTNAGVPLVNIKRIIDNPPKSRNERMAALMRRMNICEELGTGWDKIVLSCEYNRLPAPRIDLFGDSTKVTLYANKPFSSLSAEDRLWACYLHACIKHVEGEYVTNSSLRERFGLSNSSSANISRLIKEAVALKLIKPVDPETAPRYMKYIPVWA